MHNTQRHAIRAFRRTLPMTGAVLDIGSRDLNGTPRDLFEGWRYVGVDIEEGPGVDRVVPDESTRWAMDERFDAVLCCSVLEHVRRPWLLARIAGEQLKPGGRLLFTAPQSWPTHHHPIDCYRFEAEGMETMLQEAGLVDTVVYLQDAVESAPSPCIDCIGTGIRPADPPTPPAH